ncbi:calmodulin-binding protein 60 A isoform X3 [Brachypodium distachyon]|uniref:Calmodulin-binding protein n=1 Tax=Brachypodium distachyon TaxID=15368 RepID=A0A2K2CKI6_BRADI|nr:calmodulin-binding protein 60 A isoform X3 [Brachypodium distachyon]PNT62548.1 hypothetical protein BRADI_4g04911v3 [Brachypodium distachyon]|eukprot:XP_014758831.1 calmodulin-binding protein 60 A isoform X3 [Brachypodium distachyon]
MDRPPEKRLRIMVGDGGESAAMPMPMPMPMLASPGSRKLRQSMLVVLFLASLRTTVTASLSQIGRMVQRNVDRAFQKSQAAMFSKLESLEGQLRGLHQEMKQLTRLYSASQAAQQTRLETNHEHGTAERSNTRLCFLNDLQTPIYTDKNIAAENKTPIKIGIFEGQNIIRKGPLSNIKVEVMVLRGDFSNDGQESWSEEEFNSHIVKGRYGQGFVLGGDNCVVRLTNGEASLGKLRFKEGSSRTRSRKFVLAARVCKTETTGVRVQEAVMKPVTVRDRRNEANEKRHPPKLDDDVYRLEEISKDGIYHKRLQKAHIFTVHDFLKALNKNDKKLREEVLQMRKQHNSFVKMVNHARECCLREKYDLKAYENEERNVRLYFNCVDQLVGAEFQGEYITQDEFDPAQKAQANKLKECAHDKLEDISFDYVMRNNFPAKVCTSSNAAVAGPFFPNPSGQNMSNQDHNLLVEGTSAAVSLGHDEVSSLAEPLLPTEEQVPLGPTNSCNSVVEHGPLSDLVFEEDDFDVFQDFNAFSEPDFPCFGDDAVQPLWANDDPQPSSSSFPGMFHGNE